MTSPARIRSWLFAPGDSDRKMAKALAGEADRVLLDLEDAVAPEAKPRARAMVAEVLEQAGRDAAAPPVPGRLWVRVNPLRSGLCEDDLAAVIPARPAGIMLPKAEGGADLVALDALIAALEAEHGIPPGSIAVHPLITETAAAMFTTGTYRGAPRLAAMSWGAEDLADSLGAASNTGADGRYRPVFELARSLCLLGATAAGVPAIETIMADYADLDGLRQRAETVRRDGYRGMMAIHPAQVPVINAAFTPSAEEVEQAREVVRLFAQSPGAGTVRGPKGMLDRPHLSRAQQLLAQMDEPAGG